MAELKLCDYGNRKAKEYPVSLNSSLVSSHKIVEDEQKSLS